MKRLAMFVALLFFSAGCSAVRVYPVEQPRQDQDLTTGNAGYLAGTPKPSDIPKDRKLTRTTYVAEIELGKAPVRKARTPVAIEASQEPSGQAVIETPVENPAGHAAPVVMTSYTVQNNDNLEKISQKAYGTPAKWKKIYEANKAQLKTPDRIYAGQVLKIPQE